MCVRTIVRRLFCWPGASRWTFVWQQGSLWTQHFAYNFSDVSQTLIFYAQLLESSHSLMKWIHELTVECCCRRNCGSCWNVFRPFILNELKAEYHWPDFQWYSAFNLTHNGTFCLPNTRALYPFMFVNLPYFAMVTILRFQHEISIFSFHHCFGEMSCRRTAVSPQGVSAKRLVTGRSAAQCYKQRTVVNCW